MDMKRTLTWISGAVFSVTFALAPATQANSTDKKALIVAGPIAKSSSASAKITLVIPPRPDKKTQPKKTTESQAKQQ